MAQNETAYLEHIYQTDLEGYLHLIQLKDGQVCKAHYSGLTGLADVVGELIGVDDTFITPNSFYIPVRKASNVRHFRALYIDLDLKNIPNISKQEAVWQAYILSDEGKIPKPTMVVDSGRGIHLYWRINHAPIGAWHTWQALEDYLYHNLRHLGADRQATDGARVLRLPSTINSRNGQICKVLRVENIMYSMHELREEYLGYRKPKRTQGQASSQKVSHLFNSYSLHMARAQDIETLCMLRNYDVLGHRNSLLHVYAYWKGIYIRDLEQLTEVVEDLNQKFVVPHKQNEIESMIKSINRAIEKFIEYQADSNKQVTKEMRKRGGYWYKNETLIDMLEITEAEQKHLKTIISPQEKYRRNNERRTPRNAEGLTKHQVQMEETKTQVIALRKQGLTQQAIADQIGITQARVSQLLSNYK